MPTVLRSTRSTDQRRVTLDELTSHNEFIRYMTCSSLTEWLEIGSLITRDEFYIWIVGQVKPKKMNQLEPEISKLSKRTQSVISMHTTSQRPAFFKIKFDAKSCINLFVLAINQCTIVYL